MPIAKAPIAIIGIALRTDNARAAVEIPAHWNRFYAEEILSQIPNKKSSAIYAVYTDYHLDETQPYTLILGCEVLPGTLPPPHLILKQIPAASYTQVPISGASPDQILAAWQRVWQSAIPRAYTADFELYDPSAPTPTLFIAVKEPKRCCSCH